MNKAIFEVGTIFLSPTLDTKNVSITTLGTSHISVQLLVKIAFIGKPGPRLVGAVSFWVYEEIITLNKWHNERIQVKKK